MKGGADDGLFADELVDAETYNTRIEVDRRASKPINSATLQTFQDRRRARATADLVASRFRQSIRRIQGRRDPSAGRVHVRADRRELLQRRAGEQSERRRNVQLRRAGDGTPAPHLGRRQVRLGDRAADRQRRRDGAGAGADRQGSRAARPRQAGGCRGRGGVGASSFNYSILHDENTGRQNNALFAFNYLEGRFAVGDDEGTNGLPFVSLGDPRVPIIDAGPGFDGETELFLTTKYGDRGSPTPLALGTEARLIQAEAALATNDLGGFRSNLDAARANALTYTADGSPNGQRLDSPPPLTTLDMPNTAAGQQNLLFQERALDLFLTGHRLGDMRRLIWQYGRDPGTSSSRSARTSRPTARRRGRTTVPT